MATNSQGKPGIFAVRDVHSLITETAEDGHGLKKAVGATQLTAMGVGAIIGTGIFVVIGKGAGIAGPGVILSFVLAAVACTFSALSYAELASSIPVSGSAYTYTYATLGELVAWIIGWDLILEYGVSVAGIAVGWGGNLNAFLDAAFGYALPDSIAKSPSEGGVFNLPAVFVVLAITLLLVRGVTHDNGEVATVAVNGKAAKVFAQHAGVADWEAVLDGGDNELTAAATDKAGNEERMPAKVKVGRAR